MKEQTIKCDRCDKTYKLDAWAAADFRGFKDVPIEMIAVLSKDNLQTLDKDEVDLCPSCRREFREWFEKKAMR